MKNNVSPTIGTHQLRIGRPALAVTVVDTTTNNTLKHYQQQGLDIAELRLDLYEVRTLDVFADTIANLHAQLPVIVTLRTSNEGGAWDITTQAYFTLLAQLCNNNAECIDALDIEIAHACALPDVAQALVQRMQAHNITSIFSYHNLSTTPDDALLHEQITQARCFDADIIKLACMPKNANDIIRLEQLTKRNARHQLITIAMGELGTQSRINMGRFGSLLTFGSAETASAPGQMPLARLKSALNQVYS